MLDRFWRLAGPEMADQLESTSKFLSYVLRHQPDAIGLKLDGEGWADVQDLIKLSNTDGRSLTLGLIEEVVATNDKKRFAFSDDGTKIRASQGHSVAIDLALEPVAPPEVLYHGTATRFLDSIKEKGLISGSRRHVHLSAELTTAINVAHRHGKPTVLIVKATEMHNAGKEFFLSDNGVWLTPSVPFEFLIFEEL